MNVLSSKLSICVNTYILGPVYISKNDTDKTLLKIMHIENSSIYINRSVYISNNVTYSIMSFYSSNIYVNGLIVMSNNSVDTYHYEV